MTGLFRSQLSSEERKLPHNLSSTQVHEEALYEENKGSEASMQHRPADEPKDTFFYEVNRPGVNSNISETRKLGNTSTISIDSKLGKIVAQTSKAA